MTYTIYLSGPKHLLKDGKEQFLKDKALCEQYGFNVLEPPEELYNPHSSKQDGIELAKKRQKLIEVCDIVIGQCDDFRSLLEPYGEVSFEFGYAFALDKKIYAYMKDARTCAERYPLKKLKNEKGVETDEMGITFEPGPLNVMLYAPAIIVEGDLQDCLKKIKEDLE